MVKHPALKARRDAKLAAKICVNSGPRSKVEHGEVVKAGKCQRCLDVVDAGRPEVRADPDRIVVRWSRREGALLYIGCSPTGGMLAQIFERATMLDFYDQRHGLGAKIHTPDPSDERTLAQELDARGYDLSTLRFTIRKKKT